MRSGLQGSDRESKGSLESVAMAKRKGATQSGQSQKKTKQAKQPNTDAKKGEKPVKPDYLEKITVWILGTKC